MREDDLVAAIRAIVEQPRTKRVQISIGDDAAVWQPSRSHRSVVTTDALVEGVHFTREVMSFEDIGWRTTAANLSDLAAMGARPVLATIALGLPQDVRDDDVLAMYRGIAGCARADGLEIAGGDLTRAPVLLLSMTAIGEVRSSSLKKRSGGRAGDVVAVTGPLGASRAGLAVAMRQIRLDGASRDQALEAYRRPQARVGEGRWLAGSANVHAMMDCSDGLSTDLARLCDASGVDVRVGEVPIAESARVAAKALGEDPRDYALAGGEDFELIVAIAPRAFTHLQHRFQKRFQRPLYCIGRLCPSGEAPPLGRTGWDHFRQDC